MGPFAIIIMPGKLCELKRAMLIGAEPNSSVHTALSAHLAVRTAEKRSYRASQGDTSTVRRRHMGF